MIAISLFYCCKKSVCPYEYKYAWEKISETSLPEKEDFYTHLDIEDITDAGYAHAKRVSKNKRFIMDLSGIIMICMFKAIHYC